MPVLINTQSGAAEDLSQDLADSAVSQGTHEIPLNDPDGNPVSVPLADAQKYITQGYKQPSPEQLHGLLQHANLNSTPELAKAALEKAASSSTFGLSTGAERALGADPEKIRARAQNLEEEHPGLNLASSAAGLGLSALTPVGEGALLGRAGQAVEGLTGLAGKGFLSNMAARAAGFGAETALMQSGDEVSKLISEDPNQSAETAISNIGISGLLGTVPGAALGAVSPLWNKAVGSKAGQFIEDFKGRINYHLKNPNPTQALTDELSDNYATMKSGADSVYGNTGIKAQAVEKYLPQMNDRIAAQSQEIVLKVESALEKLGDDPLAGRLQNALDEYKTKIAGTSPDPTSSFMESSARLAGMEPAKKVGASQVFDASQDLKQQLQEWGKFHKDFVPLAEKEFRQTAKDLGFELRNALEDSEVWGKSADVQKKINGAFKEYLPALQDFEKKFTTWVGNDRVIDPGKVNTYVNQLGKPSAEIKQSMLKDFLDASDKYKNVIDQVHGDLGLKSPIQPSSVSHAMASLDEVTPGAKLADALVRRGFARLAGEGAGAAVGAGLGHLFGVGGIGALVGEHALGPFFSSVLPSITRPILEKATSSEGFKAAVDMGVAVAKGESALNKAAKAVFMGSASSFSEPAFASDKKRDALKKKLDEAGANPESLMSVGQNIGHYLPDHGTAIASTAGRAVQYLNSLRPVEEKSGPLDSPRVPPKSEIAAHDRALEIAEHPVSILKEVRDGTLTPQDLKSFATMFPSLHARMSQKLMEEMTTHLSKGEVIPYRTRMSLSMFMGQPLDSTLTPMAIQSAQAHARSLPSQQQAPQQTARKTSQSAAHGLQKMGSMLQTPMQAREMKRLSH